MTRYYEQMIELSEGNERAYYQDKLDSLKELERNIAAIPQRAYVAKLLKPVNDWLEEGKRP